mmetsp:Transcript_111251/g.314006  ORF Transcript_111251/g.314006 Transcript_111251/m.314006 type:complete len:206 (-) Transcript_111251:442-1059(-)
MYSGELSRDRSPPLTDSCEESNAVWPAGPKVVALPTAPAPPSWTRGGCEGPASRISTTTRPWLAAVDRHHSTALAMPPIRRRRGLVPASRRLAMSPLPTATSGICWRRSRSDEGAPCTCNIATSTAPEGRASKTVLTSKSTSAGKRAHTPLNWSKLVAQNRRHIHKMSSSLWWGRRQTLPRCSRGSLNARRSKRGATRAIASRPR